MLPTATDEVAWSVCWYVCKPRKNLQTDRDADWRVDLGGPKNPY